MRKRDPGRVAGVPRANLQEEDGPGVGNPYELDDTDQKLMQFMAKYPDAAVSEMMRLTGLTRHILEKRMERPAFVSMMRRVKESIEDIIIRGQRAAAIQLVKLVNSKNEKIALEAARILLNPMLNKHTTETKFSKEVIFRSQIGREGQMMQEVIEVGDDAAAKGKRKTLPTTGALPAYDTEGRGPVVDLDEEETLDEQKVGDLDE